MVNIVQRRSKKLSTEQQIAEAARIVRSSCVQELYQDFEVVWAKMRGYPWWPSLLFYSWDAIADAGIKLTVQTPLPKPIVRSSTGEDGNVTTYTVSYGIIMFLDKFDTNVTEISSSTVCSFVLNYAALSKIPKSLSSAFRRALERAERLMHMKEWMTPEELLDASTPIPERTKRLRITNEGELDEEEEEPEEEEDDDDDEDFEVEKGSKTKVTTKRLSRFEKKEKKVEKKTKASVERTNPRPSRVKAVQEEKIVEQSGNKRGNKDERREWIVCNDVAEPFEVYSIVINDEVVTANKRIKLKRFGCIPTKKALKKTILPKKTKKPKYSIYQDEEEEYAEKIQKPAKSKKVGRPRRQPLDLVTKENIGEVVSLSTPLSHIWTSQDGASAYPLDLLWDDTLFINVPTKGGTEPSVDREESGHSGGRAAGKRQSRSVQQLHIRESLLHGNLDPHTMVQCESYRTTQPPYTIHVHPNVVFICDLHAHLATCEIIGFLGGRWDAKTQTLSIQAAFPCRSLVIEGDDGATDVEMDPASEIELREIIQRAELEVVGWYHSHPAFAPDPSIRDIENQTSYQQLFQRSNQEEPYVGLIVGTYDIRRESPVGLFRYFHVREEHSNTSRAVHMPYELIPHSRVFRTVVEDEERRIWLERTMYPQVYEVLYGTEWQSKRVESVQVVDAKPMNGTTTRGGKKGAGHPRRKKEIVKRLVDPLDQYSTLEMRDEWKRWRRWYGDDSQVHSQMSKERYILELRGYYQRHDTEVANAENNTVVEEVVSSEVSTTEENVDRKQQLVIATISEQEYGRIQDHDDTSASTQSGLTTALEAHDAIVDASASSQGESDTNIQISTSSVEEVVSIALSSVETAVISKEDKPKDAEEMDESGKNIESNKESVEEASEAITPNTMDLHAPVIVPNSMEHEMSAGLTKPSGSSGRRRTRKPSMTKRSSQSPVSIVSTSVVPTGVDRHEMFGGFGIQEQIVRVDVTPLLPEVINTDTKTGWEGVQVIEEDFNTVPLSVETEQDKEALQTNPPFLQQFGVGGTEHFRSSLDRIQPLLDALKREQITPVELKKVSIPEPRCTEERTSMILDLRKLDQSSLLKRQATHCTSLRTRYGPSIQLLSEQVIPLIDYYQTFERRTDLDALWKPSITKWEKLLYSLRTHVETVNIPVALREDYVEDVMGYLRVSWVLIHK